MDWNPHRTLLLELAGVGEGLEVAGVRERRAECEVVRKKELEEVGARYTRQEGRGAPR